MKSKRGLIGATVAAAVILIAVVVGLIIYNQPENRLARQIDLGYRYLENGQYDEAILAFEDAIAIDERCLDAYEGEIQAYEGKGDTEDLYTFYDRTYAMLTEQDEAFMTEHMEQNVRLYLVADRIFEDIDERGAEILEAGFVRTGENLEIKEKLVTRLPRLAGHKAQEGNYEDALAVYDRLIVIDRENADMDKGLSECLGKYINILMEELNFARIRELAEKYRDIATGIDFDSILERVAELEKLEAENRAFMKKVYDYMAAADYEAMNGIYGSEEASVFVERMAGDRYLYFEEDNPSKTGKGVGVYKFGEGEYYFYYGDFVNGERKGNGVEFANYNNGGYMYFEGTWDNDAPNGEGTVISYGFAENNSMPRSSRTSGTLVDGRWDGHVERILTEPQWGDFDLSFDAVSGVPTEDKTQEFLDDRGYGSRVEAGLPEEGYIYTYDVKEDSARWSFWLDIIKEGEFVGIVGFAERE